MINRGVAVVGKLKWLGLFMIVSSAGMAETLKVMGREYVYSCGYFSAMVGDYDVTFKDESLPWGTKLTLIYGWNVEKWGHPPQNKEWMYREEVEMKSVSPFNWSTQIEATLHARTSSEYRNGLNLVVKVEVPNRGVRYYNGGSELGFFQTEVGAPGKAPCINRDNVKPDFSERHLKVITRKG